MYRYESDYIMRMIHMLRLLYEHLLGVTDADRMRSGEDEIRETMGKLVGLTPDVALAMDAGQLADMLGGDGEGLARRYALAELLRMQGEMYESLAFPEDGERCLRHALALYLAAADAPDPLPDDALIPTQTLFRRFFSTLEDQTFAAAGEYFERLAAYPDAEDAYCAQEDIAPAAAFYERLLAMPPEQVERGGLSHGEARDGLRRVERLRAEREVQG